MTTIARATATGREQTLARAVVRLPVLTVASPATLASAGPDPATRGAPVR